MLSKSKTTKALIYSTAALSLFAASHVHADETSHWTARSVDQIKADISVDNNQQTYTVRYGDTLSSIAEAMRIDVNVLANINKITNIDLIFPETVLTTTYNTNNQAVSVKVETPSSETSDTPVVAESNLTTNEVTVNGQSVVAADLSAPVETVSSTATQAPAKEESTQVVSEVTEAIASDAPAEKSETSAQAETSETSAQAETTETSAQAETTEVEHPAATSEAAQNLASSEASSETSEAQPESATSAGSEDTTTVAPVATSESASETSEAQPEAAPAEEAPAELAVTSEAESTPNTYPVGQCTWGAKTLAPWVGNNWGNAKDWIASAQAAGHSVGTTPVAGAIAVWPNDGGGYGHVAYVTSASGVKSIQVMESNYAGNMLINNYRGTFDPTSSVWGGSVFYICP